MPLNQIFANRPRRVAAVLSITLVVALALLLIIKPFHSLADDEKIANQHASEGRVITPAGELVMDATTKQAAVGALPVDFVRSPDRLGADGKGRYLLAINSGFGIQFDAESNRAGQSIAVIDLNAKPAPQVVQSVYFPTPQSVNFGVRFHAEPISDGSYRLFVSGGFENKIWLFKFAPNEVKPISLASDGKDADGKGTKVNAPFIDVSAFAANAPSPNYNDNTAAVYPTGIALSPDGETLLTANNLGDSLGIGSDLRDSRRISRISLQRPDSKQFVYPYDVEVLPAKDGKNAAKAYISLWGDGSIAVVDLNNQNKLSHIVVDRHPTAMILNKAKTKLFVVNSNADSVSVIDTKNDKLLECINLKLAENEPIGGSPEGLALSEDEKTLYVANAHANANAVVALGDSLEIQVQNPKSKVVGFIPTGQYASAVAVVGDRLFIANGKGTGVENSSMKVNNSGRVPNAPNEKFPQPREVKGRAVFGFDCVPGDYDGDGRNDLAVFRPSTGSWYILPSGNSNSNVSAVQFGLPTDIPTPGDYDGDGNTDIAVYRNSNWWILQSTNGNVSVNQFGLSGDMPTPSAFVLQ